VVIRWNSSFHSQHFVYKYLLSFVFFAAHGQNGELRDKSYQKKKRLICLSLLCEHYHQTYLVQRQSLFMRRNTMADRNLTLLCLNFLHTTTMRNLSSERLLEQTSSPDLMMMKTTTNKTIIEAAGEYYRAAARSSKNVYTNGSSPTESSLRSTVHPKLDNNEFTLTPSLLFDLTVNCSNFINEISSSSSSNYSLSNTSYTSNITDPDATPIPSGVLPPFPGKNVIIPLYTLIFFLSFIGNFLVILTLFKNRRMRTVTNVLLLNLVSSNFYFTLLLNK